MKIKELIDTLDRFYETPHLRRFIEDDGEVVIKLSDPSIGPMAMCSIKSVGQGIDWEKGKIIIWPKTNLVSLKEKEALWNCAHDFIYRLSKERTPKGNPTSLAKTAQAILDRSKEIT